MKPDHFTDTTTEGNVFVQYRDRSRMQLNAFISIILLPFIVINLKNGEFTFSFLLILLFAQTLTNVVSYTYKKRYIFPTLTTFAICFILLIYGIAKLGIHLSYWAYPILIVYQFYTPRIIVRNTIPVIILGLALVTYIYHGMTFALRLTAALALMYFFASNMIKVILDQQSKLKALADRDPLTGASNRNQMKVSFQHSIDRALRGYGTASLVYIDIDHFKAINDEYGHNAGDRVLIELVNLAKSRMRQVDEIYRSGGEEFIILLRDTNQQGALSFARDLRKQIADHLFYKQIKVTASIGVAEFHQDLDIDQWIIAADKQLYNAKRSGRNCVMPING
jgi:diguanylate cyclase (GGDEF)-like protein